MYVLTKHLSIVQLDVYTQYVTSKCDFFNGIDKAVSVFSAFNDSISTVKKLIM